MGCIGKLLGYGLLGINAVVVAMMLFSAYSPYLNPQTSSLLSCTGLLFPVFLVLNVCFLLFWLLVYRRFALFPLIALVCCWKSVHSYVPLNLFASDAPEKAIKILSYNTRGFGDMKAHTKERPNEVLEYLQKSEADIICIQEYICVNKLRKKDVDYALKNYRYKHYHQLYDGSNGLGCYSKYPILSAEPIKYKSRVNGSIAYRIKVGQDTLLVVNNHLESNKIYGEDVKIYEDMISMPNDREVLTNAKKLLKKLEKPNTIRAKQADVVKEFINRSSVSNIIVCGDFNDTPISYTHRVLSEGMNDAFAESGNGFGFSYNKNRMYFRIDHILVSKNLSVYNCTVDNASDASDHYPIWCYISFKKDME